MVTCGELRLLRKKNLLDFMVSHGPCGFWVFQKSPKPREICSRNSRLSEGGADKHKVLGGIPKCLMCFSLGGFGLRNMQVSFIFSNSQT